VTVKVKISIQNKHCAFNFVHQIILHKMYHGIQKNITPLSTLIIVRTEHYIFILEWFLKDHVTLKTGVMMLKIQITWIN